MKKTTRAELKEDLAALTKEAISAGPGMGQDEFLSLLVRTQDLRAQIAEQSKKAAMEDITTTVGNDRSVMVTAFGWKVDVFACDAPARVGVTVERDPRCTAHAELERSSDVFFHEEEDGTITSHSCNLKTAGTPRGAVLAMGRMQQEIERCKARAEQEKAAGNSGDSARYTASAGGIGWAIGELKQQFPGLATEEVRP